MILLGNLITIWIWSRGWSY